MMEMDGRDSVKCQNWERKDIEVILKFINYNKTNLCIVVIFSS